MSQYRNFCFTSFDVSDKFKSHLENVDVKYITYGNEICPESKTKHLQGYCELQTRRTLKSIKKLFMQNQLHIENRKGTAVQARDYCHKDGDIYERGTISKPGKRTDISETKELIKSGGTLRDVIDTSTNYQCIRMAEKTLTYFERKRNWKPEVYWFYGPTGTGKSKTAHELCDDPWVSSGDLKWWQGYDAHSDVIFDDFRGDFCKYHILLRILDRYPFQIENKGGSRQFLAKRIFITSPFHPRDVYETIEDKNQLLRRIDEIKMFTSITLQQDAFQTFVSKTFYSPSSPKKA